MTHQSTSLRFPSLCIHRRVIDSRFTYTCQKEGFLDCVVNQDDVIHYLSAFNPSLVAFPYKYSSKDTETSSRALSIKCWSEIVSVNDKGELGIAKALDIPTTYPIQFNGLEGFVHSYLVSDRMCVMIELMIAGACTTDAADAQFRHLFEYAASLKGWQPRLAKTQAIRVASSGGWEKAEFVRSRDLSTIDQSPQLTDIVCHAKIFLKRRDIYEQYSQNYKRIHLLSGPPGVGKSSFIKALANELGMQLAILSNISGLGEGMIKWLLNNVPKNSILLIEDMDTLFSGRRSKTSLPFSDFINVMDGVSGWDGQMIFMTTNIVSEIDEALLRSGRVDCHVELGYPTRDVLASALKRLADKWPQEHEEFLDEIEKQELKITVADLQDYVFNHVLTESPSLMIGFEKLRQNASVAKPIQPIESTVLAHQDNQQSNSDDEEL